MLNLDPKKFSEVRTDVVSRASYSMVSVDECDLSSLLAHPDIAANNQRFMQHASDTYTPADRHSLCVMQGQGLPTPVQPGKADRRADSAGLPGVQERLQPSLVLSCSC